MIAVNALFIVQGLKTFTNLHKGENTSDESLTCVALAYGLFLCPIPRYFH